jgi:hypothetical protein
MAKAKKQPHREQRRFTVLTDQAEADILAAAADGLTFVDCCVEAGIPRRTGTDWQAKIKDCLDEEREPNGFLLTRLVALYAMYDQKRTHLKRILVGSVKAAIELDPKLWASNMTLLERMFPDEFARTERVALTAIGANIGQDYDRLKTLLQDPAFRATADSLLARLGSTRE